MRDIRFKELPAVGGGTGHWVYSTLEEFAIRLSSLDYTLTIDRVIPSRDAMNQEFLKGRDDQGMGGGTEWKPFTISEEEYAELCEALATNPRFRLKPEADGRTRKR
jgi:hypothetical protein